MNRSLRILSLALTLSLVAAPGLSVGQTAPPKAKAPVVSEDDAHRKEDIARHRQMARAHDDAAKCLEGGEKESVCHSRMREACKGIAVGKYCGMRHAH